MTTFSEANSAAEETADEKKEASASGRRQLTLQFVAGNSMKEMNFVWAALLDPLNAVGPFHFSQFYIHRSEAEAVEGPG
jgi:hypothetical protein